MKSKVFLLIVWSLLVMTSCAPKKMIYLENMEYGLGYPVGDKTEMVIQENDRLSIFVSSKNPELTIPFNQEMEALSTVNSGEASTASSGNRRGREYLVDLKGNIEFPILGMLHAQGFTCVELGKIIKEQLEERNLLDDAVVMVEMLNWKIPMLGEVSRVGVIEIPDGHRITLLEAISRAGGLTELAAVDKIAVIREVGGERKMIMNDMSNVDVFKSPVFYLQQNDVVYVQPKEAKRTAKEERTWRWYSTGIGLISLVVSILTLSKL